MRPGRIPHASRRAVESGEYIDLYDAGRGDTVRLYADALHIKGGTGELAGFPDFTRFYEGGWSN